MMWGWGRDGAVAGVVLALAVTLAHGCDASIPHASGPSLDDWGGVTNGARLRARWWLAADGSRAFVSWLDRDFGVECVFGFAADGQLRCLPRAAGTAEYADAACSAPAARVRLGCDPEPFVRHRLEESSVCGFDGLAATPSEVLEPTNVPLDRAYGTSGDACRAIVTPADYELRWAQTVDPSRLARATPTLEGDGRLRAIVAVADDGARQTVGIHDTARDADCAFDREIAGRSVCLPSRTYVAFRDDECAQPVATVFAETPCGEPIVAVDWGYGRFACDTPPALYELIGRTRVLRIHGSQFDGTCEAASDELGFDVHEVAPAAPDFLVEAVEAHPGEGRLRPMRWRDTEGQLWGAPREATFWDATLESPCGPGVMGDGTTACVPWSPGRYPTEAVYADEDCTEPAAAFVADGCSSVPSFVAEVTRSDDECAPVSVYRSIRRVLEPVPSAHRRSGSLCVPVELDGVPHRLSEPLDDELMRLELVVD